MHLDAGHVPMRLLQMRALKVEQDLMTMQVQATTKGMQYQTVTYLGINK
jgi:hypothetical protein